MQKCYTMHLHVINQLMPGKVHSTYTSLVGGQRSNQQLLSLNYGDILAINTIWA